jgi:Cu(I)/Ag(I) efflux system membrane fusion protein
MKPIAIALLLSLGLAAPLAALSAEQDHSQPGAQGAGAPQSHQLHGVVNSVNAAAGRLNITHDPVESLKWPKMKMNFKARDPALLSGLKPGMVVDFEIQKLGDELVVTRITPAP